MPTDKPAINKAPKNGLDCLFWMDILSGKQVNLRNYISFCNFQEVEKRE